MNRQCENSNLVSSTWKEGRRSLNELEDEELKATVEANTQTTARELAEQLGASKETISTHFNRVGKTKRLDK